MTCALLLLAGEQRVGLLAITTVYGDVALRARIARRVLRLMGRGGVPVHARNAPARTGLTPEMVAFGEETFGPVVALTAFDSDDEAVELVNNHRLGLVSGVLGSDLDRALAIGRRIKAGIVNIGDVATSWQPHTPLGGYSGRMSGVGRLGGRYTIEALSQLQTFVCREGSCRSGRCARVGRRSDRGVGT